MKMKNDDLTRCRLDFITSMNKMNKKKLESWESVFKSCAIIFSIFIVIFAIFTERYGSDMLREITSTLGFTATILYFLLYLYMNKLRNSQKLLIFNYNKDEWDVIDNKEFDRFKKQAFEKDSKYCKNSVFLINYLDDDNNVREVMDELAHREFDFSGFSGVPNKEN